MSTSVAVPAVLLYTEPGGIEMSRGRVCHVGALFVFLGGGVYVELPLLPPPPPLAPQPLQSKNNAEKKVIANNVPFFISFLLFGSLEIK